MTMNEKWNVMKNDMNENNGQWNEWIMINDISNEIWYWRKCEKVMMVMKWRN